MSASSVAASRARVARTVTPVGAKLGVASPSTSVVNAAVTVTVSEAPGRAAGGSTWVTRGIRWPNRRDPTPREEPPA
jgi:hypothetical protein